MTPAEKSVLAALIDSAGGCLHEISLRPGDFSTPAGEILYRLIQDAVEAGKPADQVTLIADAMKLDPAGKRMVNPEVIWGMSDVYVPATSVVHHAGIVSHESARRRLVSVAAGLGQRAAEGHDVEPLIDAAQEQLSAITTGVGSNTEAITDTIDETIEGLDKPATYVETPWSNLNGFIQGWRKGALYVIGARPSVGKTVAGFQAALSLANMGPVAYTSLEMGTSELQLRMISQEARVDMGRITRKKLANDDWEKVAKARVKWDRMPLFIDPSADATMAQVARHAWSVKRQYGLAALVVDYLGLIEGRPGQREYDVVTESSRKLKLLAKALDIPVIALSQLNRGSEGREGKVPQMSDLRSSGAVEQDADVVVLLHRDILETPYEMDMIVAKNRHGITGTTRMDFLGHYSKIQDA